jgi:hypothetical protein
MCTLGHFVFLLALSKDRIGKVAAAVGASSLGIINKSGDPLRVRARRDESDMLPAFMLITLDIQARGRDQTQVNAAPRASTGFSDTGLAVTVRRAPHLDATERGAFSRTSNVRRYQRRFSHRLPT